MAVSIKRPIDEGADDDTVLKIPGHLTRDEEDPYIALHLASKLAKNADIADTSTPEERDVKASILQIAAALYCDPDEFVVIRNLRGSASFKDLYKAPDVVAKAAGLDEPSACVGADAKQTETSDK